MHHLDQMKQLETSFEHKISYLESKASNTVIHDDYTEIRDALQMKSSECDKLREVSVNYNIFRLF